MNEEIVIRESESALAAPAQHSGINSLDLAGKPLVHDDLVKLAGAFSGLLGIEISYDPDANQVGADSVKVMMLWQILTQDGWSGERMSAALRKFKRTFIAFGSTWTPAKFLECSPENDLHDQDWYNEQRDSGRAIEAYYTPDGKKCLYRYAGTGVELPKEYRRVE